MFVGVCSASAALGRHEAIFMSHPTTILNTCQQRKYYLKREKSLWCASTCRDFCEFWKLCPLVKNGVRLHIFFPLSAYSVPPKTTHCSKTVLLFQRQSVSFGFSTFICRALCLYWGKPNREMKCYKGEVQSRLNFSQVRRCQWFIARLQFWFFYVAVERINKMHSSWRCGGRKGSEVQTAGWSFCQIFIECWEKTLCLASSALVRQNGSK